ncbi:hypothetical protein [Halobellus rubicundus]|uniref:Small CPxCG-related zinc finger protein n=1 Tax=Halobellus rubicundus TaxID=2996466 RepID=A0ABD5MHB0_9EURY
MTAPQHVRIQCECGEWLEHSAAAPTTDCDCGARYVVTVTDITPPDPAGVEATERSGSFSSAKD